jgi:hypothetical protein
MTRCPLPTTLGGGAATSSGSARRGVGGGTRGASREHQPVGHRELVPALVALAAVLRQLLGTLSVPFRIQPRSNPRRGRRNATAAFQEGRAERTLERGAGDQWGGRPGEVAGGVRVGGGGCALARIDDSDDVGLARRHVHLGEHEADEQARTAQPVRR